MTPTRTAAARSFAPSLIALAAAALCASLAQAAPADDAAAAAAGRRAAAAAPGVQDTTPEGAMATVEISSRKTRSSVA